MHNKAIKDRPRKGPWAGLALLRAARPLLRRYALKLQGKLL
jgi:hypothetical protein